VYFKWGWSKSLFDINSVVFHFDDFNYGRRIATIFLIIATQLVFFHNLAWYRHFNKTIHSLSWHGTGTSIKDVWVKLVKLDLWVETNALNILICCEYNDRGSNVEFRTVFIFIYKCIILYSFNKDEDINLVHTSRVWDNLHRVRSKSKDWKAK
jgi:hypothetical protein